MAAEDGDLCTSATGTYTQETSCKHLEHLEVCDVPLLPTGANQYSADSLKSRAVVMNAGRSLELQILPLPCPQLLTV